MQKFKRKSLYLALVAAVSTVGIANTASAINVNGNGLGEVLIYPYYTTRAGMDTYLSVVNTTGSSKAVKVRFTEGKNSREVLDFNLYMSPNDMWTAAVVNTANGARLVTADKSCTAPLIPAGGQDFVNFAYKGTTREGIVADGGDGETTSLDRTREGYFEIIEMGEITNSDVIKAIKHVNGEPANCAVIRAADMSMTDLLADKSANPFAVLPPRGGLAGTASLINVAGGTDFSYDPVALEAFAETNIWDKPGSILPDLTKGDTLSTVFYNGAAVSSLWAKSEQAVSALLMHSSIINEYVLDNATLSGTDWVITMPTKRYFVPVDEPGKGIVPVINPPFTHAFWLNGACEPISVSYWDREERFVSVVDFSPLPETGNSLCWETNVVTFNNSHVLASANEANVPVNFANGWVRMSFNQDKVYPQSLISNVAEPGIGISTYTGLPTVGFMVQDFINQNAAPGLLATYGGSFAHKFETLITP